ncbi:MAG TPA: phenylalanine--tRNA ligase subunit alpha [Thermoanaerobaculia bacterium]|nr:phenylalanine--tRNA ligase subunit alpha [Thermoanaerobaculia bacterium]
MDGGSAPPQLAASEPPDRPDLAALRARFDEQAAAVSDRAGWEALRLAWLGRKQGVLRDLLAQIGSVPAAERKAFGAEVNELRQAVEARLAALDVELAERERRSKLESERADVTLPGRRPLVGSLHPVTLVERQIEEIFAELGYSVAEGPEVEDEYHNFEALNMPEDHPARDAQDTFFVEGGMVLRTHTSPVQIRTMLARKPPIRVICPGRVYRNDNDLRHSPMFHQVEGLAVAEGITFGHLKGTLEAFCKRLFSATTEVRLRPSYFPFTEPSAEVDVTCAACDGKGCPTCSHTGWMEILGCGMVDPRVLRGCGIDPQVYSGFAFGMGLDRVAMIRYGIPNIRLLFDNDVRLLRQVRS